MRRVALSLLVVAATAFAVAPATASADGLRLLQAGNARFPDRSFVLSLPSSRVLRPGEVLVSENGERVSHVSVTPAQSAGKGDFAVVLVIDASRSMHGAPIRNAVAAARAFADRRPPNQQVAIVTFNRTARVALPFTTDATVISRALASPPRLGGGTHIYDAVATAERLLRDAGAVVGSIVLLSDGADTGSDAHRDDVAAAASAGHFRIFSVGLRGHGFSPDSLSSLARRARGAYAEATSADRLAGIYDALGAQLASEYLVRYRSLAGPEEHVDVRVSVRGLAGTATSDYVTPPLPEVPQPPYRRSPSDRFLASPLSMVVIAFGAGILAAIALVALLRPRRRTLVRRMADFVSVAPPSETRNGGRSESVLGNAERSLERARWWPRFVEEVDVARISVAPVQIVVWTAVATPVLGWLVALVSGFPLLSVTGLVIPFGVRSAIQRKLKRERDAFAEQLPDNLQVLASALRAGHSLVGALSVVVDDAAEPGRTEFARVVADEQLGVALDQSLLVVGRRMASRDLEQVALVAALQHETGGNTAEVLDRVAETVRERFALRRLVKTLTAQGRLSRWIVSLLPVTLLVFMLLVNPAYINPLFAHTAGRALLVLAGAMVLTGFWVIGRIVDIKV